MNSARTDFDVLVIGSGAGGGTVAKELAPLCGKGARIGLLEWGGFFEKEHNTREEIAMATKYYFDQGGFHTSSQDMTLAFCKAVGGSTTVYTGTSIVPEQDVFDRWGVEGINLGDLKPRYEKYIQENNVHLNSPEEINENNRAFYEACKKLKWSVGQFPVNTKGCQGLGTCNLGCALHAKQGTAAVQIPKATSQGVELIPFCRVTKISENQVHATIGPAQHGQKISPEYPPGDYIFKARKIVLSAGVMNSPAILMRSFGTDFLPALGRYFTCHPALILVGEHPHPIMNAHGHPKSYYCDEFTGSQNFLLETCFYFPFTLAKNLQGYGADVDDLMRHYTHLQMILALVIDDAEPHNRVTVDKAGNTIVHYTFSEKSKNAFVDAIRASTRIFLAAGTRRVHAPSTDRFFIYPQDSNRIDDIIHRRYFKPGKTSIAAAHLMGGCRMGQDKNNSVTDIWGRVHGKKNIYVADASLFPRAAEVNPYLTIMALADRVAEAVKKDLVE